MNLRIETSALRHFSRAISNRGGLGIKIGVRTTGCSGLAYTVEFVDHIDKTDLRRDYDGFSVFVSQKDIVYLDGLSIDYVKDGLQEGLELKNANEKGRCGCGESFQM